MLSRRGPVQFESRALNTERIIYSAHVSQKTHLDLIQTKLEIKMVIIMKCNLSVFVSFCFSLIATWNKNGRKINCRYVQLQRLYPATRTDMLDILCTSRYLNKRGMRNAYVKNTNTNLRRSPDMSVWWSLAAEVSGAGRRRAEASGPARPRNAIMKYV